MGQHGEMSGATWWAASDDQMSADRNLGAHGFEVIAVSFLGGDLHKAAMS
jgi:hypothetical protein